MISRLPGPDLTHAALRLLAATHPNILGPATIRIHLLREHLPRLSDDNRGISQLTGRTTTISKRRGLFHSRRPGFQKFSRRKTSKHIEDTVLGCVREALKAALGGDGSERLFDLFGQDAWVGGINLLGVHGALLVCVCVCVCVCMCMCMCVVCVCKYRWIEEGVAAESLSTVKGADTHTHTSSSLSLSHTQHTHTQQNNTHTYLCHEEGRPVDP
jgi:hypothetical protein